MPAPFRVRAGDDPATDLGGWGDNGSIDIPGSLTLAGVLLSAVLGGGYTVEAADQFTPVLNGQITGDAHPRWLLLAGGTMTWGSGAAAGDTDLYRASAGQLQTGASLAIATAGKGLLIAEGANARMGTLTLNGATPVVVANTSVTANTRIFLTANAPGGTPAHFWVSARTAGTSFSVTGTAGDTSTVAYLLVEPL